MIAALCPRRPMAECIQVERHDIPDPCPYLQGEGLPLLLSSATSADVPALQPGYSENFAAPGSLLKNCTISTGAVKHIQQWQRQLDSHLGPQPTGPPAGLPHCSSTTSLQVDVLQWLTSLHIVPLCPDALPAARRVYTHLASLGGPHDNSVPAYPTCTAIPVASVLEAAGREASPVSGSANSLLAVSLLPPPLGETTSCASDVEALRALPRHADEHAVETDGPEGFGTLQLFVTAPLSKEEVPRLHIGAGSSLLLVVPRRSSGSYSSTGSSSKPSDNALQQAAAGAAVQALGRWVLSPLRDDASFSADLRLRLWLLGDADREANTEGDIDFGVQAKDALRDTEETGAWKRPSTALRPSAPSMLTWDGGAFLRMHLRGILQAISSLVDLQITSQIVPDSGLEDIEWDLLRRGWGLGGRVEEAFQEETARRLLNLQEHWGSDPEYSPSASVVNLSLYRPSSRIDAWPLGSALALPSWGFLTFGAPLPELVADPQLVSSISSKRLQEAAAVSGAWTAQIRSILGLSPTSELQRDASADHYCPRLPNSTICGEECRAERCAWRVETAEFKDTSYTAEITQLGDTSGLLSTDAAFALTPSRAVLVDSRRPSLQQVWVYVYPSSEGLTTWELDGLAAEAHFKNVTEAAKNIRTLQAVLLSGTDIRVAKRLEQAVHGVLNQILCSVQALRMQQCPTLPAVAKEFLVRSEADVCPVVGTSGAHLSAFYSSSTELVGRCGGFSKAGKYRQLALLLARAAMKDSKAVG
ncbi:hypothetical protein, conserved [Eimeria maxima]|uniref:Uncharacterized protein n=1 Tax=Eimeria maxima TaxID=5804 RepID=U6M5E6_EIMMA|nr:hypothetical protein, conserved [Eimeria maxima]CDJ59246.1 hypothetical protein, conserved [Eimeria maxima]